MDRRPFLLQNRVSGPSTRLLALWIASIGLPSAILQAKERESPDPEVRRSIQNDLSEPLRQIASRARPAASGKEKKAKEVKNPVRRIRDKSALPTAPERDPVLQSQRSRGDLPAPLASFEGLPNVNFIYPSDANGDIGHDASTGKKYYVQWINSAFAIWDVTGTPAQILGPLAGNTFWEGFGGECEAHNDGDPVVLFDPLASRWVASQYAIRTASGSHLCVAVSQTADPTGAYYRYDFPFGATKLIDYSKLGVWPDAYYMTTNQFQDGLFAGAGVAAFERERMLDGEPARMVFFDLGPMDLVHFSLLPADFDGTLDRAPPEGTPNPIVELDADEFGQADVLRIYDFHVDWAEPSHSTFLEQSGSPVATAAFDADLCGLGSCIPQPQTPTRLDTLADRLMHRLAYRNFGSHASMVVSHTVDADGTDHAGIRWYELRDTGSGWSIFQQGTYAPDADHRWMGSIAMDRVGNAALGFSVSGGTTFPSIRYTGRHADDPAGEMSQGEQVLVAGGGSQTLVSRWGDYSMMAVDPLDDCTFWYTQQYMAATSDYSWQTRIGAFRFLDCGDAPSGKLRGGVRDSDFNPLAGARVTAHASANNVTAVARTDADGKYRMSLPPGTYDVTASIHGFRAQTVNAVVIEDDATTVQGFTLEPLQPALLSGTVTDAGHGWPQYARIEIRAPDLGFSSTSFTDPATGRYSVQLFQELQYSLEVSAVSSGYQAQEREVGPLTGDAVEDFTLQAEAPTCNAPGYTPAMAYSQSFEADAGGFTVVPIGDTSWEWGTPTSGPNSASSGVNAWATNLSGNYRNDEWGYITSPPIDLSGYGDKDLVLTWMQFLEVQTCCDRASVEVSKDGGLDWALVYFSPNGDLSPEWQRRSVRLGSQYAVSNFLFRFGLVTDSVTMFPGWYVDDVGIAALEPKLAEGFEGSFPPAGWTTSRTGAAGLAEWSSSSDAHSGTGAALHGGTMPDAGVVDWLVLPPVQVGPGGAGFVTFWQKSVDRSSDSERHRIWVSTGSPNPADGQFFEIYDVPLSNKDEWVQAGIGLPPIFSQTIYVAFTYELLAGNPQGGQWLVDDVNLVDNELPPFECAVQPGGLVAGNVYDVNFAGTGINGATVNSDSGVSAVTVATPEDSAADDGFYSLFVPDQPDPQTFTATGPRGYGPDTQSVDIQPGGTVRQDFHLPAGLLAAEPPSVELTLQMGATGSKTFTLRNAGSLPVQFGLFEREGGRVIAGPQGTPVIRRKAKVSPFPLGRHAAGADIEEDHKGADIEKAESTLRVAPWRDVAEHPVSIVNSAAGEFEGKIYSVGGFDGGYMTDHGFVYDPDADSWSRIANMQVAREKPPAAFVDGLFYVVGGWVEFGISFPRGPDPRLEIYNPATDSWSFGTTAPSAAAAAAGVALDGKFYTIGGCGPNSCGSTEVLRYDTIEKTWALAAPYPEPVAWNACGAINGKIYCAGGWNQNGSITEQIRATYVYDPGNDSWTRLADMIQTQWGTSSVVSGGLLYISGGVTTHDSILITNETFVYDPVADAWSPGANSNHSVFGAAGACGFYKIGGDIGRFTELYPGLDRCGDSRASWLSVEPGEGTLASSESRSITVDFDAGAPEVDQPGEYLAKLAVSEDTPYRMNPVEVKMTLLPPASWGKLTGSVSSRGACGAEVEPLRRATVEIQGVSSVKTDDQGLYTRWLQAGAYTLNVSAPGHVSRTVPITVVAGATATQDVELRLDAPCASPEPGEINVTLAKGSEQTHELTLANAGAGELSYRILESPLSLLPENPIHLRKHPEARSRPELYAPVDPALILSRARLASGTGIGFGSPAASSRSSWFGGSPLPGGLAWYGHAQCAEEPNSFYVFGGIYSLLAYRVLATSSRTWRYDAGANQWTELMPMPVPSDTSTAVCYQGKIYVMGGGGRKNQLSIYDIDSDTWSPGATLPRLVEGAAAGVWAGKIYLAGGDDDYLADTGVSSQVDVYDLETDTWIGTSAPLPVGSAEPGYVQLGQYLFVAGGWGFDGQLSQLDATQRYDMSTGEWTLGPKLVSGRVSFALAATEQTLYAMGGGSLFEPDTWFEKLDWTSWPDSAWTAPPENLPFFNFANNAGFCTEAPFGPGMGVWSVGGTLTTFFYLAIIGDNQFWATPSEKCHSIYADLAWLSGAPTPGTVPPDSSGTVEVTFDAAGKEPGQYDATLVVLTNDPARPHMHIPVSLTVIPPTYGVELAAAETTRSGLPGNTVTYSLTLTNLADTKDTFDVAALNDGNWVTTAPASVGPLNAGESRDFIVTVQVPANVSGGMSTSSLVTVASQGAPAVSDQLQLQTIADTDSQNLIAPKADARYAAPGQSASFTLTITNTGGLTDSFDLSVQVSVKPWETVLSQTLLGPLAPDAQATVDLAVSVPADAAAGDLSIAIVKAQSRSDPGKSDSSSLVTVSSPRSAEVGSMGAGAAAALLLLLGSVLVLLLVRRRWARTG